MGHRAGASMINLAGVVTSPTLGATLFHVERTTKVLSNEGEEASAFVLVPYTGLLMPPTDAEVKTLGEGRRYDETVKALTPTPLVVGDGVTTESDVIQYDGRRWRVYACKDWKRYGYFRSFAELIKEVAP